MSFISSVFYLSLFSYLFFFLPPPPFFPPLFSSARQVNDDLLFSHCILERQLVGEIKVLELLLSVKISPINQAAGDLVVVKVC